ncbi:transglutaminaseTgpA domain-containing protein [Frankia sp. Cas3]|uniref:transglutaminase family protein n=1 Tax=Frankia sp. Cas3 TaxID=3073926 RepID=UPI002AD2E05F|nr:transglutaminaseTgpA domain-containing protein [Frankia sp. Cas3]
MSAIRPRAGQLVLVAAVMLLVAMVFGPFFAGAGYLVPLGGSVVLAAVVAAVASVRIRRLDVTLLVVTGCGLLFALLALFPSRWGSGLPGSLLGAFGRGLRDGWADMLTAGLPADPTGELLIVPALLLWIATAVGVVVALRTDAVLAPLPPPILAFATGLLLVAARGRSQVWLAGAILLVGGALALVRAADRSSSHDSAGAGRSDARPSGSERSDAGRSWRRLTSGRLAFGLPVVVILVVVGTLGAAVLPIADGSDRFNPRDHRHPPVQVTSALNPLVNVKAQLQADPVEPLFTVHLASTERLQVDRIRTAALGDFDGASWTDGATFVATGRTLPDDPVAATPRGTTVDAEVTVDRLDGVFLPSLGRPVGITDIGGGNGGGTGATMAFAPDSGVLAMTTSPGPGLRYDLRSVVPNPTDAEKAAARPLNDPSVTRYRALPGAVPADLTQLTDGIIDGATNPYDRLVRIQAYLRDPKRFPYDLGAAPGHSYGAVSRMLAVDTDSAQFRRSYAEQHAAAFALMARIAGFPSRVAVGYLLDQRSSTGPNTFRVTTRNAHTWPEVNLAGLGWVAFEPTDVSNLVTKLPPADPNSSNGGPADKQPSPAEPAPPVIQPELSSTGTPGGGGGGGAAGTAAWFGLAVLLGIVLVLSLIVGEKARRRRHRQRSGPPSARIGGAWREVRDRLSECGLPRSHALTTRDVVGRTRDLRAVGAAGEQMEQLMPVVNAALFAETEPGEADARRAWELTRLACRELNRAGGLPRRARAIVDPRPLLPGGSR